MANDKKSSFKVIAKAEPINSERSSYYLTIQEVSFNGSSSQHLVIKKQTVNADGSPAKSPTQVFISMDDAPKVLSACASLMQENH